MRLIYSVEAVTDRGEALLPCELHLEPLEM